MNDKALPALVDEALTYFAKAGDDGDRRYVEAIRQHIAALSQTAGVAEPNGKLVGWWNGIMPDVTERSPYGPSVRWGADAEDGSHDIPLYDGYNPIHFTKPILPSVEAFASAVWRDWMTNEQADKLGAELRAWVSTHVAPLEQALTQQWGAADAWIFHFKDDDGAVFVRLCHSRSDIERAIINDWWNGDDAVADDGERMAPHIVDDLVRTGVFHAEDGSCYAQKVTTPQPGAEALRECIVELRGRADKHELNGLHACSVGMKDAADRHDEKAKLQRVIADELESLLARGG